MLFTRRKSLARGEFSRRSVRASDITEILLSIRGRCLLKASYGMPSTSEAEKSGDQYLPSRPVPSIVDRGCENTSLIVANQPSTRRRFGPRPVGGFLFVIAFGPERVAGRPDWRGEDPRPIASAASCSQAVSTASSAMDRRQTKVAKGRRIRAIELRRAHSLCARRKEATKKAPEVSVRPGGPGQ